MASRDEIRAMVQLRRRARAKPVREYRLVVGHGRHLKTDAVTYLVRVLGPISDDELAEIHRSAKAIGGFWSRYEQAFRLPSEKAAQCLADAF